MTKFIVAGAFATALLIATTAFAASNYGPQFARAKLFGVVGDEKDSLPVYKLTDNVTTCYIALAGKTGIAMDCVK